VNGRDQLGDRHRGQVRRSATSVALKGYLRGVVCDQRGSPWKLGVSSRLVNRKVSAFKRSGDCVPAVSNTAPRGKGRDVGMPFASVVFARLCQQSERTTTQARSRVR
jgi:hypothetical protein